MSFTSRRDLYTVALGRAVSTLGNEVALIALMLRVHDSGDGSWAIAGLLAAGTLPLVLCAPLAGALVDRYDSRLLIVTSSLAQALCTGALAFTRSLPALLGLVAATGIGSAVANPTFSALVPQLAPGKLLARANSLLQGSNVVAMLAGPAVGGLLVGATGSAEVPLLVDAATFLAITAAGLGIRTRRATERRRHPAPPRGVGGGARLQRAPAGPGGPADGVLLPGGARRRQRRAERAHPHPGGAAHAGRHDGPGDVHAERTDQGRRSTGD